MNSCSDLKLRHRRMSTKGTITAGVLYLFLTGFGFMGSGVALAQTHGEHDNLYRVDVNEIGQLAHERGGRTDVNRTSMCELNFRQYEQKVTQTANGIYLVDGDQGVQNVDELKQYYDYYCSVTSNSSKDSSSKSAVALWNGERSIWDESTRQNLTYCILTTGTFGWSNAQQFQAVRLAMNFAANNWEDAANVDFRYVGECHEVDQALFSVSRNFGIGQGGQNAAQAFFPHWEPAFRDLKIAADAWEGIGNISLTGLLRHELGHVLGLVHEHGRNPECAEGQEDVDWEALTGYDIFSVMHYRDVCNAFGGDYFISSLDRAGIEQLYPPEVIPPPPENMRPFGFATATPNTAYVGDQVYFDASQSSYDSDGSIVKYDWYFDYGSFYTNVDPISTTVPYIYHTFDTLPISESRVACLVVYDNEGLSNPLCNGIDIEIIERPMVSPNAAFSFTGRLYSGSLITFDGSASLDQDGEILTYAWDFGDETQQITQSSATVTHRYRLTGTYPVSLIVMDNDNLAGNVQEQITIDLNPAIIAIVVTSLL